jgi:hypothetical protein
MKTEWNEYLSSLGFTEVFDERVEEILGFFETVYPGKTQDIFVTEYFDKEGNRQYGSVWVFTEESAMEAKNFLQEDDFDSVPLSRQVKYWAIKKTDYDFREASTRSRMVLQFDLVSGIEGTLRASRENCDHLRTIFMKHILPNRIST